MKKLIVIVLVLMASVAWGECPEGFLKIQDANGIESCMPYTETAWGGDVPIDLNAVKKVCNGDHVCINKEAIARLKEMGIGSWGVDWATYNPNGTPVECHWEFANLNYSNEIPDGGWVTAWQKINKRMREEFQGWEPMNVQYSSKKPCEPENGMKLYYGSVTIWLKKKVCK